MNKLYLAGAMIVDPENRLLVVRKRKSSYYMLPGGKIEKGELSSQALVRELKEELNLTVVLKELEYLGFHETEAVNESDTIVRGEIFRLELKENLNLIPQAEIEEAIWLTVTNYKEYKLAHLLEEFTVPIWLAGTFEY
ncbi:NUDIX domain-containing protein [Sphingobacterium sp. SRCM116780]|uniref:NUDIX hydrolase n=1 Tax=Sphingobacterium sp. SRCM116780 TaxID=2907623 RepID=UPI001F1C2B4E|nr:NUDIX domain-containing protein [Sphingobacterium sp. SRCM116780]UIR57635.1 NUDIX domain-containing protein [Sphingobacterium sp. SRCM116780]